MDSFGPLNDELVLHLVHASTQHKLLREAIASLASQTSPFSRQCLRPDFLYRLKHHIEGAVAALNFIADRIPEVVGPVRRRSLELQLQLLDISNRGVLECVRFYELSQSTHANREKTRRMVRSQRVIKNDLDRIRKMGWWRRLKHRHTFNLKTTTKRVEKLDEDIAENLHELKKHRRDLSQLSGRGAEVCIRSIAVACNSWEGSVEKTIDELLIFVVGLSVTQSPAKTAQSPPSEPINLAKAECKEGFRTPLGETVDDLGDTERAIYEALASLGHRAGGDKLSGLAKMDNESHFRGIVSNLRKRGFFDHRSDTKPPGYGLVEWLHAPPESRSAG